MKFHENHWKTIAERRAVGVLSWVATHPQEGGVVVMVSKRKLLHHWKTTIRRFQSYPRSVYEGHRLLHPRQPMGKEGSPLSREFCPRKL